MARKGAKKEAKIQPLEGEALENAARELLELGWGDEHWNLLKTHTRILFKHTHGALPCLCRKCASPSRVAQADGLTYVRDLVVFGRTSLPFWAPEELMTGGGTETLRRGMRESLEARRAVLKRRGRRSRQVNQFSGERIR